MIKMGKRIIEVSFDFMIDEEECYEDVIAKLEKSGIFKIPGVVVIGYDFKDDITTAYTSYVNALTEEEQNELDKAMEKKRS